MRAFIGLGSNVGDRLQHLQSAIDELRRRVRVTAISSVYETDPVGPPQADFLNAVCEIDSELPPEKLLALLKEIESAVGRSESERWGPREIDLDLLLYGDLAVDSDKLRLPHPELTQRAFVLVPLLQIAPDLELPSGEPASVFLEREPSGVRPFEGSLEFN